MSEVLLICALTFAQFLPTATPEDCILYQIMMVESRGQDLKLHDDKASFGYFGLTGMACAEVNESWPPEDQLSTARKYLRLMAERHETTDLYEAAGWYHGGDEARRARYIEKLQEIEPTSETVDIFKRLLAKETENAGRPENR